MDNAPVGALLGMFIAGLLIVEVLSVFFALVIARASGNKIWKGLLLGVLTPLIGPLVWAVVVVINEPAIGSISLARIRLRSTDIAMTMLGLSVALFLVSVALPWGVMALQYGGYQLLTDAAAADTKAGLIATVGSAVTLLVALGMVLLSTARRRLAFIIATVGAGWLFVTVNGLIAFSAVNVLSRAIEGLSGSRVAGGVAPEGGLWTTMLASIFAMASAILLARNPVAVRTPHSALSGDINAHERVSRSPRSLLRHGVTPSIHPAQSDYDYGDGF